ncbi:dihydroorotate dehydrogenase (quinone), mitochondrial-like isoform X1 [Nymphaea colorata]|nr:dihydroorotate dehydrogenase (quinone), mitochondrial-like isoform X1 [Nymphaea colorata]
MARQCSRLLRLGFTSMSCLFERGNGGGAPFRATAHKWSCRRFTAAPPPPPRRSADRRTRVTMGRILTGTMLGVVIAGGAYVSTADEATFSGWLFDATKLVNPLFALLDPETAHRLAISAAARGFIPREKRPDPSILEVEVWGQKFSNPLGLAAGYDKNAEAVESLLGLGFSFIEVGSVTPIPQEGTQKPCIFRIPLERAIIGRDCVNSEGLVAVVERLAGQYGKIKFKRKSDGPEHGGTAGHGIVGVNIGKNTTSEDAAADYLQGFHTLCHIADYLVINVSPPNTPGLRKLEGRKQLKDLVRKIQSARDEMLWGERGPPPLLVKISPDLSRQDLEDIAAVALTLRLDGLIISNTTTSRPEPVNKYPVSKESGGLSGKPLFSLSTDILKEMYILTQGKITLVGCGGVSSGEDAYRKIRAGATLVQIYTAFSYEGPALVPRIKAELARCLEGDGFKSVHEAVGADCR